jgi:hypothetical protein
MSLILVSVIDMDQPNNCKNQSSNVEGKYGVTTGG